MDGENSTGMPETTKYFIRADASPEAAEAARHELADLRELFRVLRDGVVVCDNELRIVRANDAFLKMANRTLRDLQGCAAEDAFYRLSILGSRTRFWNRLRESGRYELKFRNPSGRRHFHFAGHRIVHNTHGGYALVLRETTADDSLEERFLQTEKLAALAQVLSKMANQLNNPLQSVIGFAEVLAARARDGHSLEEARIIQREGRRIAHTLKSLLLYSRKLKPEPAELSINPFVTGVASEWFEHAPSPSVKVDLDLPPLSPFVTVDAFQLEQVLRHLLNHAHQAVAAEPPQEGARFKLAITSGAGKVTVSLAHNGPALPRHKLRRIFEPDFHRPAESRDTGLELSVCRDVIRAHDGRIWCESEPGTGTRFVFELPARDAAAAGASAPADIVAVRAGARVMVIDDEPSIGVLLREVLAMADFEPESFTSARAALQRLAEAPFDVIVCDINMPGMNGKEFYRHLQAHQPALASRVVFATGDLVSDHPDLFHEGHTHDVLLKPFKFDQLLGVIRRKQRQGANVN
jgi:signal transduction histidine kinase/ActR/RegA family two-component response regulator